MCQRSFLFLWFTVFYFSWLSFLSSVFFQQHFFLTEQTHKPRVVTCNFVGNDSKRCAIYVEYFFIFQLQRPPSAFFQRWFWRRSPGAFERPLTHQIGQLILLAIEENFSAMIKVKWVFYGMSANPLTALNRCNWLNVQTISSAISGTLFCAHTRMPNNLNRVQNIAVSNCHII